MSREVCVCSLPHHLIISLLSVILCISLRQAWDFFLVLPLSIYQSSIRLLWDSSLKMSRIISTLETAETNKWDPFCVSTLTTVKAPNACVLTVTVVLKYQRCKMLCERQAVVRMTLEFMTSEAEGKGKSIIEKKAGAESPGRAEQEVWRHLPLCSQNSSRLLSRPLSQCGTHSIICLSSLVSSIL